MKKFLIVFLISTLVSLAQERALFEFRLHIINNNDNNKVELKSELVSECWDATLVDNDLHNLNHYYLGGTTSSTGTETTIGYNIIWRAEWNQASIALGNYKFTVKTIDDETDSLLYSDYFYLDYRTSDLAESYNAFCDIDIYWNPNNGQLYWDSQYTSSVQNFQYSIWTVKSAYLSNIKAELEPYSPDNFQLTTYNNHPRLTWNHSSETDYINGYALYRSIVSLGSPPGSYYKFTTVNATTTLYIDSALEIGNMKTVYYRVVAINGTRESRKTQAKSLNILEPKLGGKESASLTYSLYQNYPNPFNPETIIKFSIPKSQYVTLSIYNLQGELIERLVDEVIPKGVHTFTYNAKNLPSGVYFYKINTENFSKTKKLLLVR
jgi:hypothetical protein